MKVDPAHLVARAAGQRREGLGARAGSPPVADATDPPAEAERERWSHPPEPTSLNVLVDSHRVRLKFAQDEETGIRVVQVIDAESGELIRQVPPEELIEITEMLREFRGLFISRES
ncbi:MAG TPA: flagellar protein FlaG [candidate division Zixibacteria bacterium]|nr:flagellar protein FlaG [candidate division Zixibacteria bacterium]